MTVAAIERLAEYLNTKDISYSAEISNGRDSEVNRSKDDFSSAEEAYRWSVEAIEKATRTGCYFRIRAYLGEGVVVSYVDGYN